MLQVPLGGTTTVPNTVVPSGAYKVMVSPGVPVPIMAGLALLVKLSVLLVPVSFVASWVSVAVKPVGAVVSRTLIATVSLSLKGVPALSVESTVKVSLPLKSCVPL